ncbi:hypothetical protein AA0243_1550 [Novacetimonas hansenii NRIC 0243]|nr:hypothetical protein AA0243_1550 [Novacetimonas hansenii NRIC 0243]
MPTFTPRKAGRDGQELLLHAKDGLGLIHQYDAHIRQTHPTCQPLEQQDAKFVLELLDLLAQGGLLYPQLFGRACETAIFRDSDKIA